MPAMRVVVMPTPIGSSVNSILTAFDEASNSRPVAASPAAIT